MPQQPKVTLLVVCVDGYVLSFPSPGVWLTFLVNRPYNPVFNVCQLLRKWGRYERGIYFVRTMGVMNNFQVHACRSPLLVSAFLTSLRTNYSLVQDWLRVNLTLLLVIERERNEPAASTGKCDEHTCR